MNRGDISQSFMFDFLRKEEHVLGERKKKKNFEHAQWNARYYVRLN